MEGDLSVCCDRIDQAVLEDILRERFHDNRFLRLMRGLLKAGYLEEWTFTATHSGVPQGGVVSPILSKLGLDRLAQYGETPLIPATRAASDGGPTRHMCDARDRALRHGNRGNGTAYGHCANRRSGLRRAIPTTPISAAAGTYVTRTIGGLG